MKQKQRDNRVVQPGHFVGLKWKEGWWFIQVINNTVEELKPWTLLNENNSRGPIAPNTAGDQDEIRDENSRLQLEPDDDERGVVHQLLIGAAPSRMHVIPRFGRNQNLGLEDIIEPGEDETWVTGLDSPYDNPTQQGEVYYVNDMSTLKLQAYNPVDEPQEAKLSFFVNRLAYATVTDIDMMKAMLQNQITATKHPMGLGVVEADQLRTPEWVSDLFGQHIKSTREILENGDTSNVTAGDALQFETNTQIQSKTGGG